jgi:hypothetical protein
MSDVPKLRRVDKVMTAEDSVALLRSAYCGRLATVAPDGEPYVCPLLFVWRDDEVWFHTASVTGHLRRNLAHDDRACFEADSPGEVFPYGRFTCDTGLAYQSVIAFGRVRIAQAEEDKTGFFDAFMERYHPQDPDRPRGFYPRLAEVTVFALRVERLTGKQTLLPAVAERWPARDRTRTPNARLP